VAELLDVLPEVPSRCAIIRPLSATMRVACWSPALFLDEAASDLMCSSMTTITMPVLDGDNPGNSAPGAGGE
jgi:hypothetical protein